jgi:hypothetical protein
MVRGQSRTPSCLRGIPELHDVPGQTTIPVCTVSTLTGSPPVCIPYGRRWSVRSSHLYHLTYQRLGAEDAEDLLPLGASHHARLLRALDASPSWRHLGRAAATVEVIGILRGAEHFARSRQVLTS